MYLLLLRILRLLLHGGEFWARYCAARWSRRHALLRVVASGTTCVSRLRSHWQILKEAIASARHRGSGTRVSRARANLIGLRSWSLCNRGRRRIWSRPLRQRWLIERTCPMWRVVYVHAASASWQRCLWAWDVAVQPLCHLLHAGSFPRPCDVHRQVIRRSISTLGLVGKTLSSSRIRSRRRIL